MISVMHAMRLLCVAVRLRRCPSAFPASPPPGSASSEGAGSAPPKTLSVCPGGGDASTVWPGDASSVCAAPVSNAALDEKSARSSVLPAALRSVPISS
eukprot:CAMPEP_0177674550 /NCGR_PEP_ID=MMETSP0447-20121125/26624_1 /TAXON_ID=0 /ORGANISM="Stygamoeba regulata, Strain BSH-02190019" /LENGTH=97 /DNA_ID=CAMNT_0019182671 /DNA_START=186 /DNA_END=476 /DNA_ORIENTATION=+